MANSRDEDDDIGLNLPPKRDEVPINIEEILRAHAQVQPVNQSDEPVAIKSVILNVYIKFDKKELVENFIKELNQPKDYLPKDTDGQHLSVLQQYALKSTRDPIDMSNQSKRLTFQPNLFTRKNDAFGPWNYNFLLTLIALEYQCDTNEQEQFPPVWKTTATTKVKVEIIPADQTDRPNPTPIETPSAKKKDVATLEGLFQLICLQNQRNEVVAKAWAEAFQGESIDTVEHLRQAVANEKTWESIECVKHVVKEMIKDYIQLNDPSTISNESNKIYKDSDATLYGDIHRLRRYFHYVTDTLEQTSSLDRKAVDLARDEMRRTYDDDGNVLNTIHAYLRTFCLQNRSFDSDAHKARELAWMQEKNDLEEENNRLREEVSTLEKRAEDARGTVKTYSMTLENVQRAKQTVFADAEKSDNNAATLNRSTSAAVWPRQREEARKKKAAAEQKLKAAKERLEEAQAELELKTKPIRKRNIRIAENEEKIRDLKTFLKINPEESQRKLKVKFGRGLLLYGPPGTGKSEILKMAAKYAGITMTTTALAAGELNRPYVGETERLLVDIMYRAHTIPYLICAMTIDEIDGLVPKRTNSAQQSKVDGISVLLSHIEGVKNIPNLIVLGATNRRSMMDEAFLRRMQAKCFVGRPSPAIRKKMLEPLLYMDATVFTNQVMDFLVKITTNFSGAAVGALKSSIIVAMDTHQDAGLNERIFLDLAHSAAREFSCWFGIGTLPEICRLYPNIFSSKNKDQQERYSLKLPNTVPTGRILVDLQDRKCLVELEHEATIEENLNDDEKSVNTLLARFINGCLSRNIDTIQIIDLNYLIKNNAFEENQIFELLTTMFEECDEYNRSMLIFDIDSLIMLSVSDTAMAKSLSISNIRLYQFVREKCKKAVVEQKSTTDAVADEFLREKWIVMIVKHPLLRSLLVEDIEFKKTFRQTQQEYEDEQKRIEGETPKICPKCDQSYVPAQVNHGSCRYHDGFIVDIDKPEQIISLDVAQKILQNARIAAATAPAGAEAKQEIPKLFWACCLAVFGNDQPCKTGICGIPNELQAKASEPNADITRLVREHFEKNVMARKKIDDFVKFRREASRAQKKP